MTDDTGKVEVLSDFFFAFLGQDSPRPRHGTAQFQERGSQD